MNKYKVKGTVMSFFWLLTFLRLLSNLDFDVETSLPFGIILLVIIITLLCILCDTYLSIKRPDKEIIHHIPDLYNNL